MRRKWLANVSEEPDMKNATLDTAMSMKHILILNQFEFKIFFTFSYSLEHKEQTNTE